MSKLVFLARITGISFLDKFLSFLINLVMKFVMWAWFMLQSVMATILDILTQFFFIFSGMTPISSSTMTEDGAYESIDIVNFFLTNKTFVTVYRDLALIGLGLVVVFTIVKIIKQDYFERSGPRSKGPIFRDVALSFIAFICVIPIFYFIMQAASALALLVMKVMGYEGGGLGTMLFEISWSDEAESFRNVGEALGGSYDPDLFYWYPADTFYEYFWNSEELAIKKYPAERPAEYYWYVFILTAVAMIKSLWTMILAMVTRLFKLVALFIVAPSPISQIVLDGGQKFKTWKDQVVQEAIKVVGCMLSFMTFMLIASMVSDLDFMRFAFTSESASYVKDLIGGNSTTIGLSNEVNSLYYYGDQISSVDKLFNAVGKALLLLGGLGAVNDIDSVITPLLAGGKSSMELGKTGEALQASTKVVTKGAMDITKAGVGWAADKVGKIAGGLKNGREGGLAKRREERALSQEGKLEREEKARNEKGPKPNVDENEEKAPKNQTPTEKNGDKNNSPGDTQSLGEGNNGKDGDDSADNPPGTAPNSGEGNDDAAEENEKAADATSEAGAPTEAGGAKKDEGPEQEKIGIRGTMGAIKNKGLATTFLARKAVKEKNKEARAKYKKEKRIENIKNRGFGKKLAAGTANRLATLTWRPLVGAAKGFAKDGIVFGKKGLLATAANVSNIALKAAAELTGLDGLYDIAETGVKAGVGGWKDVRKEGKEKKEASEKRVADIKENNRQRAYKTLKEDGYISAKESKKNKKDDDDDNGGNGGTVSTPVAAPKAFSASGSGGGNRKSGVGDVEKETDVDIASPADVPVSRRLSATGDEVVDTRPVLSSDEQKQTLEAVGNKASGAPVVQAAVNTISTDAQNVAAYGNYALNDRKVSVRKGTAAALNEITVSEGMEKKNVREIVRTAGGSTKKIDAMLAKKGSKDGSVTYTDEEFAQARKITEKGLTAADKLEIAKDEYNEVANNKDSTARQVAASKRKVASAASDVSKHRNVAYSGVKKAMNAREAEVGQTLKSAKDVSSQVAATMKFTDKLVGKDVKGISELRTTEKVKIGEKEFTREDLKKDVADKQVQRDKVAKNSEERHKELFELDGEKERLSATKNEAYSKKTAAEKKVKDLESGIKAKKQEEETLSGKNESYRNQINDMSSAIAARELDSDLENGYSSFKEQVLETKDYSGEDKESKRQQVAEKSAFTRGIMRKLEENQSCKKEKGETDEQFVNRKSENEKKYKSALAFALTGKDCYKDAYEDVKGEVFARKDYKSSVNSARDTLNRSRGRSLSKTNKKQFGIGPDVQKIIKGFAETSQRNLDKATNREGSTIEFAEKQKVELEGNQKKTEKSLNAAIQQKEDMEKALPDAREKVNEMSEICSKEDKRYAEFDKKYQNKNAEVYRADYELVEKQRELHKAESTLAENSTKRDLFNDAEKKYRNAVENGATDEELAKLKRDMENKGKALLKQAKKVEPRVKRQKAREIIARRDNGIVKTQLKNINKAVDEAGELGVVGNKRILEDLRKINVNLDEAGEKGHKQSGKRVKAPTERKKRRFNKEAARLNDESKKAGRIYEIGNRMGVPSTAKRRARIVIEVEGKSKKEGIPPVQTEAVRMTNNEIQEKLDNNLITTNMANAGKALNEVEESGFSVEVINKFVDAFKSVEEDAEDLGGNELVDIVNKMAIKDEDLRSGQTRTQYQREFMEEYKDAAKKHKDAIQSFKDAIKMQNNSSEFNVSMMNQASQLFSNIISTGEKHHALKMKIKNKDK